MEKLDNQKATFSSHNKHGVKAQAKKTLRLSVVVCLLPFLALFNPRILVAAPLPTFVAQTLESSKSGADQLLAQGVEQLDAEQFDTALQSFQQSLNIQREVGNRPGEAIALNNLGVAYFDQGQYEQAIASYQESMQIFWKLYDLPDSGNVDARTGIAASLNNQSIAHLQLGQYQKAIELCHGGMAIFRNLGDRTREAAALNNMGLAYEALEDYDRAIGYFQEALATAQSIGDARGEAMTLNNLQDAYNKLGQTEKAKQVEQQALAISQQIDAQGDIGGAISSNDYLLVRQKGRSLALVFSNPPS